MSQELKHVNIFADGACTGDPGPGGVGKFSGFTLGRLNDSGQVIFRSRLFQGSKSAQGLYRVGPAEGVTALAQAVFGGLGLAIAGVPFAAVLTAVMLLLSIAQIGVVPVLGFAAAWLYWTGESTWGTFLLAWTVIAGTMDNFLRPMLIRKGADLPLLLVFAGVVGGLLAFGLIGIFVGPVILAVADALLKAWIDDASREAETSG